MNIPCNANIVSTLTPHSRTQPTKSLVMLSEDGETVNFHITTSKCPNSKAAYNISSRNLAAVHTRLLHDGKMSLTFKSPPQLMMLSDANPKQLEILLKTIKNPKYFIDLDLKPLNLNRVTKPKADVKSMTVTSLKQYPSLTGVGFPKTLTHLTISSLNYRHLDTRICALEQLQFLDLSNNKLKKLPHRLWEMQSLASLNVSNNEISELPETIPADSKMYKTLKDFNISDNKLTGFPSFLRHCKSLCYLRLAGNRINFVPNYLKTCSFTLQHLDLDGCNLKNLPACLTQFSLNELKIHGNYFPTPVRVMNEIYKERSSSLERVTGLQECCVKSIIRHGIQPSSAQLPEHLLNYIATVQYCGGCFQMVMGSCIVYYYPANLKSFSRSFTRLEHPPTATGFACSNKCFKRISEGKSVVPATLFFNRTSSE